MQLWEKKRKKGKRARGRDGERVRKKKIEDEREGDSLVEPMPFSLRRSLFSLILTVYSFSPSVFPAGTAIGAEWAPSVKLATGFYSRMSIFRQLKPTRHATKAPTYSLRGWRERKKGRKTRQSVRDSLDGLFRRGCNIAKTGSPDGWRMQHA